MSVVKKILDGRFLKNKYLRKNIHYLFLIFVIIMVFVLTESVGAMRIAKIQKITKEINTLKEESVFIQSKLMDISLINEVDKQVKERKIGLNKLSKPPKVLIIRTENEANGH